MWLGLVEQVPSGIRLLIPSRFHERRFAMNNFPFDRVKMVAQKNKKTKKDHCNEQNRIAAAAANREFT